MFYDMAVEAYDARGDFFPIWGTCLGFELLALFAVDGQENLKACSSQQQALPLSIINLSVKKDIATLKHRSSNGKDYRVCSLNPAKDPMERALKAQSDIWQ